MKKTMLLMMSAAMFGGLVVLGGAKSLGWLNSTASSNYAPQSNKSVQLAHFTGTADPYSMNFTTAAQKTLPVVVNIQSAVRMRDQGTNGGDFDLQNIPEPFRQFFGPRMFQQPQPDARDKNDNIRMGTGSGVIISPDGYIVTNNHVVAGADELSVTLSDKRTFKAKVIGTDPSTDLGLLKIDASSLPFVNFSNSDAVEVGEWVLAVGNPFDLTSTVTAGIISAKGRDIHILQDQAPIESFIQTDAAINPGNSGGALVNLNGDLIGINSAIASPTGAYAGYGFAIPSNIVAKVVDDLKTYGVAQRGYLGVVIREVNSELAKEKDLGVTQGAYVDSLSDKSAAEQAGIRKGDVLIKIDETPVLSSSDVLELVGRHRPGDKLHVQVLRGGTERDFTVTLRNREGNTDIVKKTELSGTLALLGADLQTLSDKEARQLDIPGGVKITHLGRGRLSNQTDIETGFVILKVDGQPVKTVEDFTKALSGKEGGVMLEGIYPNRPGTFYYAFGMQ